jgi:hypothetical protein
VSVKAGLRSRHVEKQKGWSRHGFPPGLHRQLFHVLMSVKARLRSRHLEKRAAPARVFKPLDPKAKSWSLCKLVEKGYRLATDSLSLSLLSLSPVTDPDQPLPFYFSFSSGTEVCLDVLLAEINCFFQKVCYPYCAASVLSLHPHHLPIQPPPLLLLLLLLLLTLPSVSPLSLLNSTTKTNKSAARTNISAVVR